MTPDWTESDVRDQTGKTAVVTGANVGLGYEVARVLAGAGARVIMACRNLKKAEQARSRIYELHPQADAAIVPLDLGSLASVESASLTVLKERRIDILVNNAGIMMPPRTETEDGFESQLGINHLGHFALTGRLMPRILATEGARVVNVSSKAHYWGELDFRDLNAEREYDRRKQYGNSKLANLLFTFELQRRFDVRQRRAFALSAHPGISGTELGRDLPALLNLVAPLFRRMAQVPAMGALPILRAAAGRRVEGGQYYGPGGWQEYSGHPILVPSSRKARDPEAARKLWRASVKMTGVDPEI